MQQKIIEYKIVTAKTADEITKTINQMITEGWIPSGGVSITQGPFQREGGSIIAETHTHQAMVKLQVY